jgi:hypothetical protein
MQRKFAKAQRAALKRKKQQERADAAPASVGRDDGPMTRDELYVWYKRLGRLEEYYARFPEP